MRTFIGIALGLVILVLIIYIVLRKKGGENITDGITGDGSDGTTGGTGWNAGETVYLDLNSTIGSMGNGDRTGIPIYTYPYSATNDYLLGLFKPEAYAGKPIGVLVSTVRDWAVVRFDGNIGIWHNTPPVYPYDYFTAGNYYIKLSSIKKTPY